VANLALGSAWSDGCTSAGQVGPFSNRGKSPMLAFESWHAAAGAAAGRFDDSESIRLVDSLKDSAVFHLDLTGRVISWNRGAERVFGLTSAGLRARDYSLLLRPAEASNLKPGQPLRTALARGRFRIADWRTRTDGTRFWAEIMISPLMDHNHHATGFLAVVKDMTDHKRRLDRLRAALDLLRAVMSDHPLDQALHVVVRQALWLLKADGAHVTVPVPGTDRLVVAVAEGWNARLLQGANWPARHSMIARVMESGRPTIVDDASVGPRGCEPPGGAARVGPVMAVPLARRRLKIGTLVVYNRVGRPAFRRTDMELLRCFAGHAALAIQQARSQRDRRRTIAKERERLARILQSGPVRSLRAILQDLNDATDCCEDLDLRERLGDCIATVDGALDELRHSAVGFRPRILSEHRLDEAVRLLARDLELRSGLQTVVEMQAGAAERLTAHAGDVIQIVREALSNVSRHARAQHCRLRLRLDRDKTRLEIEDDGVGFDLRRVRGQRDGLRNVRERVARMGGQLRIETAPGGGTALRVAIPRDGSLVACPPSLARSATR
jgi:PAS domain S-box-containing protein